MARGSFVRFHYGTWCIYATCVKYNKSRIYLPTFHRNFTLKSIAFGILMTYINITDDKAFFNHRTVTFSWDGLFFSLDLSFIPLVDLAFFVHDFKTRQNVKKNPVVLHYLNAKCQVLKSCVQRKRQTTYQACCSIPFFFIYLFDAYYFTAFVYIPIIFISDLVIDKKVSYKNDSIVYFFRPLAIPSFWLLSRQAPCT